MRFLRSVAQAALVMLAAAGAAQAEGRWKIETSKDPDREEARAIIFFESARHRNVQLAFKCQQGKDPEMLLGFYAKVYEGKPQRLRLNFKVETGDEFNFEIEKLVEATVPPHRLHSGVGAEVHKLWFLTDKAIGFHTYAERMFDSSMRGLLRALRDGSKYAEITIPAPLGEGRARYIYEPQVVAIPLKGSTAAINRFSETCGIDLG